MNKVASLSMLAVAIGVFGTANAQISGSSSLGAPVADARVVASGWSVRKSVLGRIVYNETNQKIGAVQDVVIARDRSVSYLIIGAGGFVGMSRHDVAVPISQVGERAGKLMMSGGSAEAIMGMPAFEYTFRSFERDALVANAERNITEAEERISDLEAKATAASEDAKASLRHRIVNLQRILSDTQAVLGDMQQADAKRWKEFAKKISAAVARLRKATRIPTT